MLFFSPFKQAPLTSFICSFNHAACEPPLTKFERMFVTAFIPTSRWSLESFVFAVWCQCAGGELWMPECPPPFYPGPYTWSSLSFPPGFFTGSAYQRLWHLFWFYQFPWYPSSTCSFTSLNIIAKVATSTEYKAALEDHSLYQPEFVKKMETLQVLMYLMFNN